MGIHQLRPLPTPPRPLYSPLQHLMLRVLLSGPPEGLSSTDATHGLAFLAMLFNATSVVSQPEACTTTGMAWRLLGVGCRHPLG